MADDLASRSDEKDPVAMFTLIDRALNRVSKGLRASGINVWPAKTVSPFDALVSRLQSSFFISGVGETPRSSTHGLYGLNLLVDGHPCGSLGRPDVKALAEHSRPAPLGVGSKTVLDPSLRQASEISGQRITFGRNENAYSMSDPADLFLKAAVNTLAARGCILVPQLYKMHIYGPGDHFVPHSDTLHASNHVATVVVLLPSQHEGGRLTVSHAGKTHTFPTEEQEKNEHALKWCAFYTDCIHSVGQVTSGTRVVLQYDLFLRPYRTYYEMDDGDDGDGDNQHSSTVQTVSAEQFDINGSCTVCGMFKYDVSHTTCISYSNPGSLDTGTLQKQKEKKGNKEKHKKRRKTETEEKSGSGTVATLSERTFPANLEERLSEKFFETELEAWLGPLGRSAGLESTEVHAASSNQKLLKRIRVACKRFLKQHRDTHHSICILLQHRYSMQALEEGHLKGSDSSLVDALKASSQLNTHLHSVLLHAFNDQTARRTPALRASAFDMDHIHALAKGRPSPLTSLSPAERKADPSDSGKLAVSGSQVCFAASRVSSLELLRHQDHIEYTGNDSMPEEDFYHAAVCMISLKRD